MANRSYLYTVDTAPSKKKRPKPIRSLTEHNWEIPLVHKILASENPKVCPSLIWDQQTGVVANFAAGKKRLLAFLDVLEKANPPNAGAFDESVRETKAALANKKYVGKLVVLEAGEIFDLMKGAAETNAKKLVEKEIPAARKKVDAAIAGKEKKWLATVVKTWERELGLYWCDVLYFDFG